MNILVFLAVVFTLYVLTPGADVRDPSAVARWGFATLAAATFWALVIG